MRKTMSGVTALSRCVRMATGSTLPRGLRCRPATATMPSPMACCRCVGKKLRQANGSVRATLVEHLGPVGRWREVCLFFSGVLFAMLARVPVACWQRSLTPTHRNAD